MQQAYRSKDKGYHKESFEKIMLKRIEMGNKDYSDLNATESKYQQKPLDSSKGIKTLSVFTCKQRDIIDESVKLFERIKEPVSTKIQSTSSRAYVQIKATNIGNILTSIMSIVAQEENVLQKYNIKDRVIGLEINEGIDEIRVLCSTKKLAIKISSKLKESLDLSLSS